MEMIWWHTSAATATGGIWHRETGKRPAEGAHIAPTHTEEAKTCTKPGKPLKGVQLFYAMNKAFIYAFINVRINRDGILPESIVSGYKILYVYFSFGLIMSNHTQRTSSD